MKERAEAARDVIDRPPPWRDVFRGKNGRLTIGLLMLEAMVAVYALVITTIMPAVRADLGGTSMYGFAFAVWSLATVMTIPMAGHAVDRFGPARPLVLVMFVQLAGLTVSALSQHMAEFIAGLFLQGCAGGSYYALSLGTVAKTFPAHIRARVMALLATMWILPGLFGPPLGAFMAIHFGWRWAFVIPVPLLAVVAALVLPAMRGLHARSDAGKLPIRWSVQTTLGLLLLLGGMSLVNRYAWPLMIVGLLIGVPALLRLVPSGTLRARPGIPAAAAAIFLLSGGFFTVDSFVPLMLTQIRGLSLGTASVIITLATVTWSIGSWWQSRSSIRVEAGRIVTIGASMVLVGMIGVASGLTAAPAWISFAGWTLAGGGMGMAFPTIPLSVMGAASEGHEAGELSSTLLMDTLGMAIGAGLGGVSIAVATAGAATSLTGATGPIPGITGGIAGAFALGIAALAVLLLIARRIPKTLRSRDPDA